MAVLNCSSRQRIKHFVFALVVAILMFFPAMASAMSCEGRPTEEDFHVIANHVMEVIVERHYWYDYSAVPRKPAKVVFGVNPIPTNALDGANVIAIVPEINEAFLWLVCGNEFTLKESLGADGHSLEKLEKGQYKSFFDMTDGARFFEMVLHFEPLPKFGPLDHWKRKMLGKIQDNIACFLAENGTHSSEQKPLSIHIGDFNRQSTGVLVAIPELNDLWTLNFKLDSAGVPDDIGHSHEQELSEAKEILRSRLFEHSFVRNVELRCIAQ